jgi:hypothetical protein
MLFKTSTKSFPIISQKRDNMGQIRENKQEVIDVVYNFYADLYKGQNIGLDEIKEYLCLLKIWL